MTSTSSAGLRAMWLITPQIFLGATLAVLPDTRAPRLAQALVLLHVATAIASMLALVLWVAFHARPSMFKQAPRRPESVTSRRLLRLGVVIGIVAAYGTGMWDAWGGEGSTAGFAHAAAGLLAGLPLSLHLLFDSHRLARVVAFAYIAVSPLAMPSVRAKLRPPPAPPVPTEGATTRLRDAALYDRAEWCGGCHVDQFEEWRHSVHARAFAIPEFRESMAENIRRKGAEFIDSDLGDTRPATEERCVRCHAPATFYGLDKQPALQDVMLATQGITCSFCHTTHGRKDRFFFSMPESVERYIGQNASTALARDVGDLLIRWRPEQHRRDYFSPGLAQSNFCGGCHMTSFDGWLASPYAHGAIGAPNTTPKDPSIAGPVECQDCHMAAAPSGGAVVEPGRLVPWGPLRRQKRFHGMSGRNIRAAESFADETARAYDRKLRDGMMTLHIDDVVREGDLVRATATLSNRHVGHFFPTGESGDVAAAYLTLELLDAAGQVLSQSAAPTEERDFSEEDAPGRIVALLPQYANSKVLKEDRRVPPRGKLTLSIALPSVDGAATVRVRVRSIFEPGPIVEAGAPVPAAAPAP